MFHLNLAIILAPYFNLALSGPCSLSHRHKGARGEIWKDPPKHCTLPDTFFRDSCITEANQRCFRCPRCVTDVRLSLRLFSEPNSPASLLHCNVLQYPFCRTWPVCCFQYLPSASTSSSHLCEGCDVVGCDHAPQAGVAQGV